MSGSSEATDVRYHMLRPAQIVARRRQYPVVYIPVGTLEWHGEHNPVGADALQAEGLAILCARQGGGLVFPPLYYGENRLEALVEANPVEGPGIAERMELPAENFSPDAFPYGVAEQTNRYNRLLVHILAQAHTLGFEVGVLVAGHYPLIDHARAAVLQHNQWSCRRNGMLAWACVDHLFLEDRYSCAGDHGGGWETSHCMALHPETVDLSLLPAPAEKPVGVSGRMSPHDANAAFGAETLQASADGIVKEVQVRLADKAAYFRHGRSLDEGR